MRYVTPNLKSVNTGMRREKIQGDKFPLPKVRDLRQLDWPTDEEFGRQILAGALAQTPRQIAIWCCAGKLLTS